MNSENDVEIDWLPLTARGYGLIEVSWDKLLAELLLRKRAGFLIWIYLGIQMQQGYSTQGQSFTHIIKKKKDHLFGEAFDF